MNTTDSITISNGFSTPYSSTTYDKRVEIISRLLKDDAISFVDALALMATDKEYVYVPQPYWHRPYWQQPWVGTPIDFNEPIQVTCTNTTASQSGGVCFKN